MEKIIDCDFRLEKDFGAFKKGHIFKSYGGLVSGIDAISFLDKNWFTPVNMAALQATVQPIENQYRIGFVFARYFPKQKSTPYSASIDYKDITDITIFDLKIEGIIIDRGMLNSDNKKLSRQELSILEDFHFLEYVIIIQNGVETKIDIQDLC